MSDLPCHASYQILGRRDAQEDRVLSDDLPPMSAEQARRFLQASGAAIHERTKDNDPGSTYSGAISTGDGEVVTAQLGDSFAALLVYDPKTHGCTIRKLTDDHHPRYKRIDYPDGSYEDEGECTSMNHTYSLKVNRAFGDAHYGQSVSKKIDFRSHTLSDAELEGKRVFVITGSDGAAPTPGTFRHHAQMVGQKLQAEPDASLEAIAKTIVRNAENYPFSGDNISIGICEVKAGKTSATAVFDGHGFINRGHETSEAAHLALGEHVQALKSQGPELAISEIIATLPEEKRAELEPVLAPEPKTGSINRWLRGMRDPGTYTGR